MHPEIPEHETLNNPYTYRDDVSAWKESDAVVTEDQAESLSAERPRGSPYRGTTRPFGMDGL